MCDVSKDEDIDRLFATLKQRHGKLHALVHSVAYAPADELKGDFINTTREGFRVAHDVSVYSLIAVSRAAAPLMEDGGSIITMTYYGAEKVVPHYNVMAVAKAALECSVRYLASDLGKKKIRVNAISAGPITPNALLWAGTWTSRKWVQLGFFWRRMPAPASPAKSSMSTAVTASWGFKGSSRL